MNPHEYPGTEGVELRRLPYPVEAPHPDLSFSFEQLPSHFNPFPIQDDLLPSNAANLWPLSDPFSLPLRFHTTATTTVLDLPYGDISCRHLPEPSINNPASAHQVPVIRPPHSSIFVPEIVMTASDPVPQSANANTNANTATPFLDRPVELDTPIYSWPAILPPQEVPGIHPPAVPSLAFPVNFDEQRMQFSGAVGHMDTIQQNAIYTPLVASSSMGATPDVVGHFMPGDWNPVQAVFAPEEAGMTVQSDEAGVCNTEHNHHPIDDPWEAIKGKLFKLYIVEAMALETAMMVLKHTCGFEAS